MLKRLFSLFKKGTEEEKKVEISQEKKEEVKKEQKKVRKLTAEEIELFKKAIGITPHNYWQWTSRTKNFKLLTDGEWIWVEGYEEHIGKSLPLTQARAWKWEFIRQRIKELNIKE